MANKKNAGNNYQEVRKVLIIVLVVNLCVTVIKIVLGFLTGALSIVADGFHSLVDSSSNLIGLAAISLAQRPADKKHPYGYTRYETIGTLAIGVLLLVAAFEIGSAVVERISSGTQPNLTPLSLVLMGLTFLINLGVVLLETRAGRKLNSQILIADATHTKTDLFVTASVLVSLIGVWLGWTWLDPLVASLVVILILRAAFIILRDVAGTLADASLLDPDKIEAVALDVPGVWYVHRVRSRGSPASVFVDLHVKVYPGMSTDQAHAIATEVEQQIINYFPEVSEVLVHIEPGKFEFEKIPGFEKSYQEYQNLSYDLRQIGDMMGLGVHDVHVSQDPNGNLDVEAHLELQAGTTLVQAHEIAERYEARVQEQWPQVTNIITHLEPLPEQVLSPFEQTNNELIDQVYQYLKSRFYSDQIIEVHTHTLDGHESVAIRLCVSDTMSLDDAHNLSEEIERELINQINGVRRVIVHVEPSVNCYSVVE